MCVLQGRVSERRDEEVREREGGVHSWSSYISLVSLSIRNLRLGSVFLNIDLDVP